MKKSDVFKLILAGVAVAVPGASPAIAGVTAGVEKLIHRDDDPTNDLEETAAAIAEIVEQVLAAAEGLTHKDFVNDAALKLLTSKVRVDLTFYVTAVHALKPTP